MSVTLSRLFLIFSLFVLSGIENYAYSTTSEGVVITVGDSLSEGYGMVLPKWLSGSGWHSINAGKRSSGLNSRRPVDWMSLLPQLIESHRPNVVVMSFGANDAGMNISSGGRSLRFGSEEWAYEYAARMSEVIRVAKNNGAFVIWMPIPTFKDTERERQVRWLRSIQEVVASSEGVLIPDVSIAQRQEYKQKDGVHYNMSGYVVAIDRAFRDAWGLPRNR